MSILVFALGTSCCSLGTSTGLTETLARSSCRWNPAYASYWSVHGFLRSDHKCVVLQDGDNISGVLRSLCFEQPSQASEKSYPFLPAKMSNLNPTPALDDKVTTDNSPASPVEKEDVVKTDVLSDTGASENPYFQAFAANDAEWHKAFEKKLMRKVDLRLIPLMVIMYLNNFIDR